jgi:DHA2 family multidrug resistance protein
MAASYDGLPAGKTDQASALMTAARNTGGSIGIAIVSNILTHREQFHQSRLAEHAIPSSVQFQDTLNQTTNFFVAQGSSLIQARQQAIAWIGQQVQTQASYLGYVDAFWVLMLISLAAVPLALTLRKVKLGGPVHMGH